MPKKKEPKGGWIPLTSPSDGFICLDENFKSLTSVDYSKLPPDVATAPLDLRQEIMKRAVEEGLVYLNDTRSAKVSMNSMQPSNPTFVVRTPSKPTTTNQCVIVSPWNSIQVERFKRDCNKLIENHILDWTPNWEYYSAERMGRREYGQDITFVYLGMTPFLSGAVITAGITKTLADLTKHFGYDSIFHSCIVGENKNRREARLTIFKPKHDWVKNIELPDEEVEFESIFFIKHNGNQYVVTESLPDVGSNDKRLTQPFRLDWREGALSDPTRYEEIGHLVKINQERDLSLWFCKSGSSREIKPPPETEEETLDISRELDD